MSGYLIIPFLSPDASPESSITIAYRIDTYSHTPSTKRYTDSTWTGKCRCQTKRQISEHKSQYAIYERHNSPLAVSAGENNSTYSEYITYIVIPHATNRISCVHRHSIQRQWKWVDVDIGMPTRRWVTAQAEVFSPGAGAHDQHRDVVYGVLWEPKPIESDDRDRATRMNIRSTVQ